MRQLYVMSEPPNSNFTQNYLIGMLSENNGKYSFQYSFKNDFPLSFLKIQEFPDVGKTYGDSETRKFISKIIPPENYEFINLALETANLTEYDEWELLKHCGQSAEGNAFLYTELPKGAICRE